MHSFQVAIFFHGTIHLAGVAYLENIIFSLAQVVHVSVLQRFLSHCPYFLLWQNHSKQEYCPFDFVALNVFIIIVALRVIFE